MTDPSRPLDLETASGPVRLRAERPGDDAFLFALFRSHMLVELATMPVDDATRDALVRMQFQSQTTTYRAQFPAARFDIVEIGDQPIGRIVIDPGGETGCIVDFALLPDSRGQGRGTAIMASVLAWFAPLGRPMRCKVMMHNEPSARMCRRVGFEQISADPPFLQLEWRPPAGQAAMRTGA